MGLSGNWLLAQRLLTTTLYNLLRLVFIVVQRIYWQLNGTAQQLREARLLQNYDRSAQVLDVVLFHKFCTLQTTTVDNFLCTHNRFENPQYITDNDNITLMTINQHDAVFCEAKEKGRPSTALVWHTGITLYVSCLLADTSTSIQFQYTQLQILKGQKYLCSNYCPIGLTDMEQSIATHTQNNTLPTAANIF